MHVVIKDIPKLRFNYQQVFISQHRLIADHLHAHLLAVVISTNHCSTASSMWPDSSLVHYEFVRVTGTKGQGLLHFSCGQVLG